MPPSHMQLQNHKMSVRMFYIVLVLLMVIATECLHPATTANEPLALVREQRAQSMLGGKPEIVPPDSRSEIQTACQTALCRHLLLY